MKTGYDALGLYHNAEDRRLVVPKRVPAFGWTINVNHRHGPLILGALAAAAAGAIIASLL